MSINVSGHKYGLTYPGIGFVVWRSREHLPEDLVFRVNYLGGDMPTFTLNFSRPGNQVVGQYYNFLRLGREGYTQVMQSLSQTARWLAGQLAAGEHFELISDGSAIPVLAFRLAADRGYTEFDVSHELRTFGWQVPAYTMPDNATDVSVLRVVVREGLSADLAVPCATTWSPRWPRWTNSNPAGTSKNSTSRTDRYAQCSGGIRTVARAGQRRVRSLGQSRTMQPTPLIPKSADLLAEAVVDLDAIAHNVAVLRDRAGSAQVMAVVKADGYGHGLPGSLAPHWRPARPNSAWPPSTRRSNCAPMALPHPCSRGCTAPEPTSPARWPPTCRSRCPRCASSTSCLTRFAAPVPRRR
ncbi:alanine racemase, N-terminal domain protein [Mycobacterium xenopi 4042]|uniref:glutamate decarboxylase n=1 Tax=Mycobacterium xenopi 4042 TaxID=1299334 RepID=X7YLT3_MYCXE|nr:alanine racemase, N-terminal domain protein [Mycobacterium xenopi 4042]